MSLIHQKFAFYCGPNRISLRYFTRLFMREDYLVVNLNQTNKTKQNKFKNYLGGEYEDFSHKRHLFFVNFKRNWVRMF